jgi:hypothetical protein
MDKESFLEGLRKQFANEIQEVYLECEHDRGEVDISRLNSMLKKLMAGARLQGLPEKDFLDLLKSTLPDHWDDLDWAKSRAA